MNPNDLKLPLNRKQLAAAIERYATGPDWDGDRFTRPPFLWHDFADYWKEIVASLRASEQSETNDARIVPTAAMEKCAIGTSVQKISTTDGDDYCSVPWCITHHCEFTEAHGSFLVIEKRLQASLNGEDVCIARPIDLEDAANRLAALRELSETTPAGDCLDDYRAGYEAAMGWVKLVLSPSWESL